MDTAFFILSTAIPLILAFTLRSRILAILSGTICFWLLLIIGGEYNLASDPDYDSFAPAIAIVAGWIPGLMYSLLCVLVAMVATTSYDWTLGQRLNKTEAKDSDAPHNDDIDRQASPSN